MSVSMFWSPWPSIYRFICCILTFRGRQCNYRTRFRRITFRIAWRKKNNYCIHWQVQRTEIRGDKLSFSIFLYMWLMKTQISGGVTVWIVKPSQGRPYSLLLFFLFYQLCYLRDRWTFHANSISKVESYRFCLKIHSDVWPISLLNFTGNQKVQNLDGFNVALVSLSFRNTAIYLTYKTNFLSVDRRLSKIW